MTKLGGGRVQAFSAGSMPNGAVHPLALETLVAHGLPATGFRSKSWDEFSGVNAPKMDFIVTVCDNAAREACPISPGHQATDHWSLADPAAVEVSLEEQRRAFEDTYRDLERRIQQFVLYSTS